MNPIIAHTLSLLEDAGLAVRYPEFRHLTQEPDEKYTLHFSFTATVRPHSARIEENVPLKLMLVFTVMDFYVDTIYPHLEGLSYKQKYEHLPANDDYQLIFKQLFRLAKLIRNAMIHNPAAVTSEGGGLEIRYSRPRYNTRFALKMSDEALIHLQTAIFMYVKGDLGRGGYFVGIMRSIYRDMLAGVDRAGFADDIQQPIAEPSGCLQLRTRVREIHLNPRYEVENGIVKVLMPKREQQEWEGWDFYIEHQGAEYLIPMEALDAHHAIAEQAMIGHWRRQGRLPNIIVP